MSAVVPLDGRHAAGVSAYILRLGTRRHSERAIQSEHHAPQRRERSPRRAQPRKGTGSHLAVPRGHTAGQTDVRP
jgi:hypothetical protein